MLPLLYYSTQPYAILCYTILLDFILFYATFYILFYTTILHFTLLPLILLYFAIFIILSTLHNTLLFHNT